MPPPLTGHAPYTNSTGLPFVITNQWTGPSVGSGGIAGSPVLTATLTFPDGVRSVALIPKTSTYQFPNPMPAGVWQPIMTGGATPPTAAALDRRLAAGDVLFYIQNPPGQGYNPGIYACAISGIANTLIVQQFAWGMAQLASLMSGGLQASGMQVQQPAPQQQQPVQQAPAPAPVVVVAPRWPYYTAGLVAVGVVAWILLD
jgi:hypothetical protein